MAQESHDPPTEEAREMGEEVGPVDWYGYTQSAQYANNILPRLREMAGYSDPMGVGTYTTPDSEEASFILSDLVDAFREGATE